MLKIFRKKQPVKKEYDRANQKPILRCSICTGEQVAGFKNIHTGQWEEVMPIKNEEDLETFKRMYDLKEVTKEY
ncbi:MAG: aspartate dehydrogenase [Schaedlerella sp.]|uniref:aspartate dehydrogenase n=1 Tax=Schaedlerella sp. TaxID=2676057 RepID=UPI00261C098A|nr:aspartate dehydrogenase [uncultured Schaedlerella sp.]